MGGFAHLNLPYFSLDLPSKTRLLVELMLLIVDISLLILRSTNRTHVSRWAVTEPNFARQANTSLFIPDFQAEGGIWFGNVFVVEELSKMILVNRDRVLYELDLSTLALPESEIPPPTPHCQKFYGISNDGCRLVEAYTTCSEWFDSTTADREDEHFNSPDLGMIRTELRLVYLSVETDHLQRLDLVYSEPKPSALHNHVVTFSPDLSMMQAGPHIFDLLAPSHPPLFFPEFPSDALLQKRGSHIAFSSCNGYLVVVQRKDPAATGEPAKFGLFRICRTAGRIETIAIDVIENLVTDRISAAFHPTLPLLVSAYITYPESDTKDIARYIQVMEIDLQELKPNLIAVPRCDSFVSAG